MEDILSLGTEFWGLFTHLCTAVYQPAARVRLMTTSTGIRSATASLLALMVRRIPFPALSQDDIILKLQILPLQPRALRFKGNMSHLQL